MGKLTGKTILITGASQGIGAEVARTYAKEGATVILMARRQKRMEAVYDSITATDSPEPFAICFDLLTAEESEFNQLAATVAAATEGKLDGIVHCASYFNAFSSLEYQTVAEWVKQYRINTVSVMGLLRAFFPLLRQSADASVILVSESHSETPRAYMGGFGASKSALNYLGQTIADEWSRFENMRLNILIPGAVNSPQRQKTHPGETAEERQQLDSIMPDFVYWASEESKGKTGQIVYLTQNETIA